MSDAFRPNLKPTATVKHDPANSTNPDRPHNHDVHTTSHIRCDIIRSTILPVRVGGGHGKSIGQHIDAMVGDALSDGDRVAAVSFVITEDDWETLRLADQKGDDVSFKEV